MFCSHCGTQATGNFCYRCGSKLAADGVSEAVLPCDWHQESNYDSLIRDPAVRNRIERHAARAKKRMSAEELFGVFDKALAPITGVPIPLGKVAGMAAPIYARFGIKTGQQRSERIARPIGESIVGTLCSLAHHGRVLKKVHQAADGCVLEAELPSDFWSFAGDLIVTIERDTAGTKIAAVTNIPGQLYDWGKSKKCLSELFDDLSSKED